jgi:hypothetical protein
MKMTTSSSEPESDGVVRNLSKPELVTLALGELGADHHPVDTEDVAVKARELAPTAFSWRLYPQHINLELVRVALVDASRGKSGSLAQGRGRGGWMLTDLGVAWLQENRDRLLIALGRSSELGGVRVKQPETQHRERERIRLTRSDAWRKWSSGLEASVSEASNVFRIDQYTSEHNRLAKVRVLRQLFAGDSDLDRFLSEMAGLISTSTSQEKHT